VGVGVGMGVGVGVGVTVGVGVGVGVGESDMTKVNPVTLVKPVAPINVLPAVVLSIR